MEKHELKLKVEGIDCPGCATDVERVIGELDGVVEVNVNYAEESITVEHDADLISEKQIVSRIRGMGLKTARVQDA